MNTSDACYKKSLKGWWTFDEAEGNIAEDHSGNVHTLTAVNGLTWIGLGGSEGAIALDGENQFMATKRPVLKTTRSYSVAAWVRLDSSTLKGELRMPQGEYAWTAVSQDSPTHCPFYLGVRGFETGNSDGSSDLSLHWNMTIAPIDGSVEGTLEWKHASSSNSLTKFVLDRWVFLVGVCDVENHKVYLYIPGSRDLGTASLISEWPYWQANGGLLIGRARWLGRTVDQWPGTIGPVRAYSCALTEEQAQDLYAASTFDA